MPDLATTGPCHRGSLHSPEYLGLLAPPLGAPSPEPGDRSRWWARHCAYMTRVLYTAPVVNYNRYMDTVTESASPRDEARDRLTPLMDKWKAILQMVDWHISGDLVDGRFDEGEEYAARCEAHWEYLQADIDWSVEQVLLMGDEELEEHIVHELMHALVSEMRPRKQKRHLVKHEERVVTMLSRVVVDVYRSRCITCPVQEPEPAKVECDRPGIHLGKTSWRFCPRCGVRLSGA